MERLNIPEYTFRIEEKNGKRTIFDRFRKKMVVLTPEEWVRQNVLVYLVDEKNYPESLLAVESSLNVAHRTKRTDAVVYHRKGNPLMIIECKAPSVKISEKTFDQAVRYNITLQVDYLMVTNGLDHYCCKLDYAGSSYTFLEEIPRYEDLE
jgi:hypothetical protein